MKKLALTLILAVALTLTGVASAAVNDGIIDFYVPGTNASESLYGTSSTDDEMTGQGGNDALYAYDGWDRLYGGCGSDYLVADWGNDRVYAIGTAGSCLTSDRDTLNGGYGDDVVAAQNYQADNVNGGYGYDHCYVDQRDSYSGCEVVHKIYN